MQIKRYRLFRLAVCLCVGLMMGCDETTPGSILQRSFLAHNCYSGARLNFESGERFEHLTWSDVVLSNHPSELLLGESGSFSLNSDTLFLRYNDVLVDSVAWSIRSGEDWTEDPEEWIEEARNVVQQRRDTLLVRSVGLETVLVPLSRTQEYSACQEYLVQHPSGDQCDMGYPADCRLIYRSQVED